MPHAHEHAIDTSGELVEKGLKANSLSFTDSVVMGLASTAPAYSLAATLGYIILEVGERAPAAIVLAFIPMLFTSYAYKELNRAVPDAGTTFTWAAKAFGPWVGWMGGWAVAVSGTIFLASAGEVAASYFYTALNLDSLADSRTAVVAGGVFVIVLMSWVSYRGIDISKRMQTVLIILQFAALALFAGIALVRAYADDPEGGIRPSLEMINVFGFDDRTALVSAITLAVFLFWGWESTLSINEETSDPDTVPGRAAVTSTVILLLTYVTVAVAVIAYGGVGEGVLDFSDEAIEAGAVDDVFSPVADAAMPALLWMVLLAIVISALSSTQTTILPTTRGTLAMAVYKALPERFGRVHPRYLSPSYSTVVMAVIAITYYVGMSAISTDVLADTVLSIGLAITFYYALTGFSCVWYFRRTLTSSVRTLFLQGILPLVGAIVLSFVFVQSAITYADPEESYTTIGNIGSAFVIGIGSLLLGVFLMAAWAFAPGSQAYFQGRSLSRHTPVLVPDGEHATLEHLLPEVPDEEPEPPTPPGFDPRATAPTDPKE